MKLKNYLPYLAVLIVNFYVLPSTYIEKLLNFSFAVLFSPIITLISSIIFGKYKNSILILPCIVSILYIPTIFIFSGKTGFPFLYLHVIFAIIGTAFRSLSDKPVQQEYDEPNTSTKTLNEKWLKYKSDLIFLGFLVFVFIITPFIAIQMIDKTILALNLYIIAPLVSLIVSIYFGMNFRYWFIIPLVVSILYTLSVYMHGYPIDFLLFYFIISLVGTVVGFLIKLFKSKNTVQFNDKHSLLNESKGGTYEI